MECREKVHYNKRDICKTDWMKINYYNPKDYINNSDRDRCSSILCLCDKKEKNKIKNKIDYKKRTCRRFKKDDRESGFIY